MIKNGQKVCAEVRGPANIILFSVGSAQWETPSTTQSMVLFIILSIEWANLKAAGRNVVVLSFYEQKRNLKLTWFTASLSTSWLLWSNVSIHWESCLHSADECKAPLLAFVSSSSSGGKYLPREQLKAPLCSQLAANRVRLLCWEQSEQLTLWFCCEKCFCCWGKNKDEGSLWTAKPKTITGNLLECFLKPEEGLQGL